MGEGTGYTWLEDSDGSRRKMTTAEKSTSVFSNNDLPFFADNLLSSGYTRSCYFDVDFEGCVFPSQKYSWKTNQTGMKRLIQANRIIAPSECVNENATPFEFI
jgi:adenine-specific DNA-methyltransferase